jgi:hypothetical protein
VELESLPELVPVLLEVQAAEVALWSPNAPLFDPNSG